MNPPILVSDTQLLDTEPCFFPFCTSNQALVEVITERHHRHHLLDILTEVTKRVVDQQKKCPDMGHPVQVPAPMYTLTKHLYL